MATTQTSGRQTESAEADEHRDQAGRPEQQHDSFSFQQFQRIDDVSPTHGPNAPRAAPHDSGRSCLRAAQINEWLARLAAAHAPAAQVVDGGRSFEGRPIRGLRLFPGPDKPRVLIEADMAPGNSVDWAYSIGIKYAFAMELRNPVQAERYVRASAIVDTGEETFEAIITILAEVAGRLGSGGGQPSGQPQQRAPRPQRPRAPKPSRRRKLHANGSTNVTVG
ncbi:hypothetical protein FOCC_FOCC012601 [Frankliniella occidentalis]|nr:hypothetical protein FOCC_FOCC012601 [Frankliniella occidentalis]